MSRIFKSLIMVIMLLSSLSQANAQKDIANIISLKDAIKQNLIEIKISPNLEQSSKNVQFDKDGTTKTTLTPEKKAANINYQFEFMPTKKGMKKDFQIKAGEEILACTVEKNKGFAEAIDLGPEEFDILVTTDAEGNISTTGDTIEFDALSTEQLEAQYSIKCNLRDQRKAFESKKSFIINTI